MPNGSATQPPVQSVVQPQSEQNQLEVLAEIREEYITFDARLMFEEELNYELKARNLFKENMRTLEKKKILTDAFRNEENNAHAIDESPYNAEHDINECQRKLIELQRSLVANRKTKQDYCRIGVHMAHLEKRINRIKTDDHQLGHILCELNAAISQLIEVFIRLVANKPNATESGEYENTEATSRGNLSDEMRKHAQHGTNTPIDVERLEQQLRATFMGNQNPEIVVEENAKSARVLTKPAIPSANFHVNARESFVSGTNINADAFFGTDEVPRTLTATLFGQNRPNPFFSNGQANRPSSIRNSVALDLRNNPQEGHGINIPERPPISHDHYAHRANPIAGDIPTRNQTYGVGNYNGRHETMRNDYNRTNAIPIHKWNIYFSGESKRESKTELSLNEFLYTIQVQCEVQNISDDELLSQIHWLLRGSAKTWYYASYRSFDTYEHFVEKIRRRFLSHDHVFESWSELCNRVQGRDESALAFLSKMVVLFQALPMPIDVDTQISVIRRGLKPEIGNIIAPWQINSIADLEEKLSRLQPVKQIERKFPRFNFNKDRNNTRKVDEIGNMESDSEEEIELSEEEISAIRRMREEGKKGKVGKKREKAKGSEEVERRNDIECFNCREKGHIFRDCTRPRKVFCYKCGKPDVISKNCTCETKNSVSCLNLSATETSTDSDE